MEKDGSLTAGDKAMFHEVFSMFDKDEDGELSAEEFGSVMRTLGQNPSAEELEDMLKECDLNRNGTVSFPEFLEFVTKQMKSPSEQELLNALRVIDADDSGAIAPKALKSQLLQYNEQAFSADDFDQILKAMGKYNNGELDIAKFAKFLTSDLK